MPAFEPGTYVVEEAVASGLEEIILITGCNKRAIENQFTPPSSQDRGKMEELTQIQDHLGAGLGSRTSGRSSPWASATPSP